MNNLIDQFRSTFEFSLANAFFALSTWVPMWVGMLSFASVSFGAVGGFSAAWLMGTFDVPFPLAIAVAAVLGFIFGYLLAFPLLRLTSHWMALATISLVLITHVVVLNFEPVTGGPSGKSVGQTGGLPWILGLLLVTMFVLSRLRKSRFGVAAHAAREDGNVAAALGIHVDSIRRQAFAMSGLLGAIGGVLLAGLLRYISPDTFYISLAFIAIAAVVLGGSYHWAGPIIGAIVFTFLPELLRSYLPFGDEIANGVLVILIMIFLPRGIIDPIGPFAVLRRRFQRTDEVPSRQEQSA